MNYITLTGIAASICTALASVPQLTKIIKTRKADDISLLMLGVLIVGLGLWVVYGVFINDYIVVVANSVPFLVNLSMAILSLIYKRRNAD